LRSWGVGTLVGVVVAELERVVAVTQFGRLSKGEPGGIG
jgi:hypothetical protein